MHLVVLLPQITIIQNSNGACIHRQIYLLIQKLTPEPYRSILIEGGENCLLQAVLPVADLE